MRTPVLGHATSSASDSWFVRVRENFRQVLTSTRLSPSSANGAPIHLLKLTRTGKAGRAQTASLLTHAGVVAAVALFAMQTRTTIPPRLPIDIDKGGFIFRTPRDLVASKPSLGHKGGGGEDNPIPATRGSLAPRSPIQLASPRLPDDANHLLPVPQTILDLQVPPIITPVNDVGLPWMPKETNSGGPGSKHGIGSGKDNGMGDMFGFGRGRRR